MVLHIFHDDKFIDLTINQINSVDKGNNKYVVITNSQEYALKYVKSHDAEIIVEDSEEYHALISSLSKYNAVVIHYLCSVKAKIMALSSLDVKFVWMIWGGDAYQLIKTGSIGKKNKEIELTIYYLFVKNKIKRAFKYLLFNFSQKTIKKTQNEILNIIPRFKYFTTIIPSEKEIVTKHLPLKATYLPYSYGSIEMHVPPAMQHRNINGGNILVGNSGDPTNNHLLVFNILKGCDITHRKIITPLSYGFQPYIDQVKDLGFIQFQSDFTPLIDFMKLDEYYNLLTTCSVCIMAHDRQQALGNILMMGWLGAKVVVSEKSPVYDFLKNLGVTVFSIERNLDFKKACDLDHPLTNEEITQNRNAILSYYGEEIVKQRTLYFLKHISE